VIYTEIHGWADLGQATGEDDVAALRTGFLEVRRVHPMPRLPPACGDIRPRAAAPQRGTLGAKNMMAMKVGQQILFGEFKQAAIKRRRLAGAPAAAECVGVILFDHVIQVLRAAYSQAEARQVTTTSQARSTIARRVSAQT